MRVKKKYLLVLTVLFFCGTQEAVQFFKDKPKTTIALNGLLAGCFGVATYRSSKWAFTLFMSQEEHGRTMGLAAGFATLFLCVPSTVVFSWATFAQIQQLRKKNQSKE